MTNEIVNKYENSDIYSNIGLNNNLEKNKKKLVLNLLENNFKIFLKDRRKIYP